MDFTAPQTSTYGHTQPCRVGLWVAVGLDEKAAGSGWRQTLKTFASWDKDTLFVPGHGQLCGQRGIATVRQIFDDIDAQADKMFSAGVPVEEAQHRYIVPEKFKNFPVFAWGFTIGPAITKLYAERRRDKKRKKKRGRRNRRQAPRPRHGKGGAGREPPPHSRRPTSRSL